MAGILELLQQLVGQVPDPAPDGSTPIVVQDNARRANERPIPDLYRDFSLNNTDAIRERDAAERQTRDAADHHGYLGTRGTLRDILGIVGDAFLVQGKGDPVYAPQRQREREADALAGFTVDPRAGAERLAGVGNTDKALDLYRNVVSDENQDATLASIEGSRQDQARNRLEDNLTALRNLTARRLYAAGDNPTKIAYALQLAQRDAERNGVDISELGVQESMTPEQLAVVASGDMTVNQQVQVPFTERRVATGEYNAQTGRINANRPRAAPQQRAQTELEYFQEVSRIPSGDRTPEERDFYKKYINGTRGGSRIGAAPPPPPPGGSAAPRRFRVIRSN